MINHHLICPFQRRRCYAFLISSLVKRKSGAKDVCRIDEPHSLPLLIAISKGRVGAKEVYERDEPHRGSAFDSPGLASVASYPGLIRSMEHNAVGVALF